MGVSHNFVKFCLYFCKSWYVPGDVDVDGGVSVFVCVDIDVNGVVGVDVDLVGVVDVASCRDRLPNGTQLRVDRIRFSVRGFRITFWILHCYITARDRIQRFSHSLINLVRPQPE